MGQANDKQSKTGKSPAKSKNFIRNLKGRDSKKHGRKKSDTKRDAIDKTCDKTPDSDSYDAIEAPDKYTVECVFKTLPREGEGAEAASVHSEVTVTRCSEAARSATRDEPSTDAAPAPAPATSPSTSGSVFTDPLTPLAVELNQCYYSAESDSARDELPRTLTPTPSDARPLDMPHDDAASLLSTDDVMDKEEKRDVFDDSSDRVEDEKAMGCLLSSFRGYSLQRTTHECDHEFDDNRLKASPGQTSFTVSKHRKVELPPVVCDTSLDILSGGSDRRHSSLSDTGMLDSNVLRKVASLTLEKHAEFKVARPKFVPEKLDFKLYEKFEGQMLLNWFISSVNENSHLKQVLSAQDLKNLGIQYCTDLLAAGVLRQISDKVAPSENVFKPNLMYYWAHMELPTSQPHTPGRLQMCSWPPEKELITDTKNLLENDYYFSQNNNEEVSDIGEAKRIISQLKQRLQELEYKLEKHKITAQIEQLNKNIDLLDPEPKTLQKPFKSSTVSKEVQTCDASELNNSVIKISDKDPIRTNVHNLDLSSTYNSHEIKENESKTNMRSEKIENYCKLNKSRDYNKVLQKEETVPGKIEDVSPKADLNNSHGPNSEFPNGTYESSSDASFCSTYTTSDLNDKMEPISDDNKSNDLTFKSCVLAKSTHILYSTSNEDAARVSEQSIPSETVERSKSEPNTSIEHCASSTLETGVQETKEPSLSETLTLSGSSQAQPVLPSRVESEKCKTLVLDEQPTGSNVLSPQSSLPEPTMGPPLSPMPGTNSVASPMIDTIPTPPPISGIASPPPPMPGIAPPPPPMPGTGPPPSPMPGMGPPPPPMPFMGPPPPPMPDMGPPPPPMPDMGPPPPPMPDMGPPPSPMPGMGPPPPPMPGMGPPPPPMPGMGPPPPPMPGMGPPPPPMPGMGPPPPPMPGLGPPPPPMPEKVPVSSGPPVPGAGPPPPPAPSTSGPVPFPAPPVGGWGIQKATLRKNPVKPAAPMKPLYWTRILAPPSLQVTQGEVENVPQKPLWLEIEEASLDNIDEFTDLFSRQVVKAPVRKKVEVKAKIQPVKILDSKRSQNVGILAQSLHVEFSEIENAIYNFDTSVVSLEALQQIYELRATEEEIAQIKEHLKNKPDIPLDRPEAFLHDLSGIPNFAERISCFMFQAEFEDAGSTTMHKLDNLKHTCEFLISSEPLKKLFAIILTLGNYMNGGNGQRGQADGFGLEILSKLKDVKSKQSNVTLLHFIVRTYMRSLGGALASGCVLPVPEPGDVTRAAALDFADVAANLQALQRQLTACKEKTRKVIETDIQSQNPDEPPNESTKRLEVFKEKMTTFIDAAEEKLKTENENLEECRTKFIATVKFYQYTPKCGKVEDCEPKEFFSLWTSFCSDVKDIFKKEEQIAIKEKLKEAKRMQEERRTLTQPKKEGGLKARLQKLSNSKKS